MLNSNIKRFLTLLLTILFLISSINIATANQQQENKNNIYISYMFTTPQVQNIINPGETYTQLSMDGCINYGAPGEPSLPVKVAKILLPPYSKVKNIKVTPIGEHHLTISNPVKTGESVFFSYGVEGVSEGIVIAPDENGYSKIYNKEEFSADKIVNTVNYDKNSFYPGKLYDNEFQIQYKRGFPIMMFTLYPVQYKENQNLVTYYDEISVKIEIEKDYSLQFNEFYRGLPRDKALISELVDNPLILEDYNGFNGFVTYDDETKPDNNPPETSNGDSNGDDGSSGDDPSDSNSGTGGDKPEGDTDDDNAPDTSPDDSHDVTPSDKGDMLIITTESLFQDEGLYNLQYLAAAHIAEGMNVTIKTTRDIGNSKEKIKAAIMNAYLQGVDYVLLVGDDDWNLHVSFLGLFGIPLIWRENDIPDDPSNYIPTYQEVMWNVMLVHNNGENGDIPEIPNDSDNPGETNDPVEQDPATPDEPNNPDDSIQPNDPVDQIEPPIPGPEMPSDSSGGGIGVTSDENNDGIYTKSTAFFSLLKKGKGNSIIDVIIEKLKQFFTKLADLLSGKQEPANDNSEKEEKKPEGNKNQPDNDNNLPSDNGVYVFGHRKKDTPGGDDDGDGNGDDGFEMIPITAASDVPYACFDEGVDVFAEVYIGRAPVSCSDDLHNFVKKTVEYMENNPPLDALLVGQHLGFGGIMEYANACLDETIDRCTYPYLTDGIQSSIYNIHKLYEKFTRWNANTLVSNINDEKANILNNLGHANWQKCMKLTPESINYLDNNEYGVWYSQGCFANAYDYRECISEYFTTKSSNGAVAFIGNSWFGFGAPTTDGPSQKYCRQFWDAIFGEGKTTLGEANQDSKEDNAAFISLRPPSVMLDLGDVMRCLYYGINLVGDPALTIKGVSEPVRNYGYDGPVYPGK